MRIPFTQPPVTAVGFAIVGLLVGAAALLGSVNPFTEVIVTRNVFALKEPPPPPPPPDTTPPPPNITLVGIANVLGERKVVLKPQPPPGSPPRPVSPGSPPPGQEPPLVISEGAMVDGISVDSIDEVAGVVRLSNNGIPLTLTLENDGPKVPTGPVAAAPVPGGAPGQPGVGRPPGVPGAVAVGGPAVAQTRTVPGTIGANVAVAAGVGGVAGVPQTTVPQRAVRTQQRTPTFEEQMLLLEAQRERTRALVEKGLAPPLPPPVIRPNDLFPGAGGR